MLPRLQLQHSALAVEDEDRACLRAAPHRPGADRRHAQHHVPRVARHDPLDHLARLGTAHNDATIALSRPHRCADADRTPHRRAKSCLWLHRPSCRAGGRDLPPNLLRDQIALGVAAGVGSGALQAFGLCLDTAGCSLVLLPRRLWRVSAISRTHGRLKGRYCQVWGHTQHRRMVRLVQNLRLSRDCRRLHVKSLIVAVIVELIVVVVFVNELVLAVDDGWNRRTVQGGVIMR